MVLVLRLIRLKPNGRGTMLTQLDPIIMPMVLKSRSMMAHLLMTRRLLRLLIVLKEILTRRSRIHFVIKMASPL